MSEQVGAIHYDVELNTAQMVRGQREVDSAVSRAAESFNVITRAVKLYSAAMALVKVAQFADDLRMLAARIDVAAGKEFATTNPLMIMFRQVLFSKIVPNVNKLGLMTPRVRQCFEDLQVAQFADQLDTASEELSSLAGAESLADIARTAG